MPHIVSYALPVDLLPISVNLRRLCWQLGWFGQADDRHLQCEWLRSRQATENQDSRIALRPRVLAFSIAPAGRPKAFRVSAGAKLNYITQLIFRICRALARLVSGRLRRNR